MAEAAGTAKPPLTMREIWKSVRSSGVGCRKFEVEEAFQTSFIVASRVLGQATDLDATTRLTIQALSRSASQCGSSAGSDASSVCGASVVSQARGTTIANLAATEVDVAICRSLKTLSISEDLEVQEQEGISATPPAGKQDVPAASPARPSNPHIVNIVQDSSVASPTRLSLSHNVNTFSPQPLEEVKEDVQQATILWNLLQVHADSAQEEFHRIGYPEGWDRIRVEHDLAVTGFSGIDAENRGPIVHADGTPTYRPCLLIKMGQREPASALLSARMVRHFLYQDAEQTTVNIGFRLDKNMDIPREVAAVRKIMLLTVCEVTEFLRRADTPQSAARWVHPDTIMDHMQQHCPWLTEFSELLRLLLAVQDNTPSHCRYQVLVATDRMSRDMSFERDYFSECHILQIEAIRAQGGHQNTKNNKWESLDVLRCVLPAAAIVSAKYFFHVTRFRCLNSIFERGLVGRQGVEGSRVSLFCNHEPRNTHWRGTVVVTVTASSVSTPSALLSMSSRRRDTFW